MAVIKDLTEFMKDNKELWEKLNFQFEIIYTEILMNTDQVDKVNALEADIIIPNLTESSLIPIPPYDKN